MSDPSMGEWFYNYDRNGNPISQTDSKGQIINFAYDCLSRLSSKTYPNGNSISYYYDDTSAYSYYGGQLTSYGIGRLAEVVDNAPQNSSGATRFFYDKQGRTTQVLRTIEGTQYTTQFQYDSLNRVTNLAYPDGDQANYAYDQAGNMSAVSNISNTPYATFSGYNALGQVGQISFPMNGVNTTMTYETATNRLHELTTTIPGSGTAQDYVYGYDNNGNITSIQNNVDSTQSQSFTYDWLNRLTTAQGAYGTLTYSLTGNPDSTGDIDNPGVANSNYKQQQALTYDYDNRVSSIGSNSFVYDYTGARVMKNNTVTYVNKYYEIRNGIAYKYIFAGGRRIATIIGTSIYFCHPDHVGSLRIATDINANKVQTVAYDPYGNVDPNHSSGSIIPYTYTGKELDPETGLYYFGARYYDSAQGRFITPDTIVQSPGNPQTLNRYAYAGNNPMAFVDPSGHGFFSFLEDFFAALFGAAITVLTWGAGAPVACMLGGMVAGATDAAMHGGSLISIVQGAFFGAIGGAIGGGAYLAGGIWPAVAAAGGLALAGGTGGVKGLESFAAGFAGSLAGGALGDYLNKAINSNVAQAGGYNTNMTQNVAQSDAQSDVERFYDSAEPASATKNELEGDASCYTGKKLPDGSPFDPNGWSAAMYGKGTYGKTVDVYYLDDEGNVISQALNVKVNDSGPFAVDSNGHAIFPLQPNPDRIIDLTPAVYQALTGYSSCRLGPGVIPVRVEWW
jgi:RHS repeat-associated protein